MKKKLNCILLVDDSEADNYFHEMVITEHQCAEKVHITTNGKLAMKYLRSVVDGVHPQPDLILLDINMPVMNGWEFLEEYKTLKDNQLAKVVLVMLTTSVNPQDKLKAEQYGYVDGFLSKPLTKEHLDKIIADKFPEYL